MLYIIDGVQYDSDSSVNQNILRRLVDREVGACMTSEVEFILANPSGDAPFTWEDLQGGSHKECDHCSCTDFWETYGDDEDLEIEIESYDDEDEPETYYKCPVCDTGWESEEEARQCCGNEEIRVCAYCKTVYTMDDFDELDEREEEIFEWWWVTDWFADKLADRGEAILNGWNSYWGRTCSGQAILLDDVIAKIAFDMEILEGQKYSWEGR